MPDTPDDRPETLPAAPAGRSGVADGPGTAAAVLAVAMPMQPQDRPAGAGGPQLANGSSGYPVVVSDC